MWKVPEGYQTKIPGYMHAGIEAYVNDGVRPGHFLTAVLCNDLKEAISRADLQNQAAIVDWVKLLYNHAPIYCWGSAERFNSWEGLHEEVR